MLEQLDSEQTSWLPLKQWEGRKAFDLAAASLSSDVASGYQAALGYAPAGARSLIDLFGFVEEWIRDLGAVAAGADVVVFNHDARDHLRSLVRSKRVAAVDVPAAFARIETARELARGNVNPQLVVSGLVRDLRSTLGSAPAGVR
jgi:hypothetical protein